MLDPGFSSWPIRGMIACRGGSDPPSVAYVYAPDRKAERPNVHLAGLKGPRPGFADFCNDPSYMSLRPDGIPISTSVAPGIQFMAAQML